MPNLHKEQYVRILTVLFNFSDAPYDRWETRKEDEDEYDDLKFVSRLGTYVDIEARRLAFINIINKAVDEEILPDKSIFRDVYTKKSKSGTKSSDMFRAVVEEVALQKLSLESLVGILKLKVEECKMNSWLSKKGLPKDGLNESDWRKIGKMAQELIDEFQPMLQQDPSAKDRPRPM